MHDVHPYDATRKLGTSSATLLLYLYYHPIMIVMSTKAGDESDDNVAQHSRRKERTPTRDTPK